MTTALLTDAVQSSTPELPLLAIPYSEPEFCDWLANAPAGSRTVYFRGHLAYDRVPSKPRLSEENRKKLVLVAKRAMQAAEDGRIHLLQQRFGDHDYAYIAAKVLPAAKLRLLVNAA